MNRPTLWGQFTRGRGLVLGIAGLLESVYRRLEERVAVSEKLDPLAAGFVLPHIGKVLCALARDRRQERDFRCPPDLGRHSVAAIAEGRYPVGKEEGARECADLGFEPRLARLV